MKNSGRHPHKRLPEECSKQEISIFTEIERAVEFHDKACLVEEQGKVILAEVYCRISSTLFEQIVGSHMRDAAKVFNRLAFLRESSGNYEGSLYYAKKSAWMMESLHGEFSRPQAHDMRLRPGCVISALFVRHMQIGRQNG